VIEQWIVNIVIAAFLATLLHWHINMLTKP